MPHGVEKKFVIGKHHATPIGDMDTPIVYTEVPRAWYPSKTEQDTVLSNNGITSNWKYRKYLTHNAISIIKDNPERYTGMTGMTQYSYNTAVEDRRTNIAGMVVGHGMGESGDLRRKWLASNGGENPTMISPHIVMNDQGVRPHE